MAAGVQTQQANTPARSDAAENDGACMCASAVLFLDVVGYTKFSIDAGDGVALTFLNDVEQALVVALKVAQHTAKVTSQHPRFELRMGIHVGPIKRMRDINAQPNVIGDGINTAQRIMNFAAPGKILVSRAYYEMVSVLSARYRNAFLAAGRKFDKHKREHDVYEFCPAALVGSATPQRGSVRRLWLRTAGVFVSCLPHSRPGRVLVASTQPGARCRYGAGPRGHGDGRHQARDLTVGRGRHRWEATRCESSAAGSAPQARRTSGRGVEWNLQAVCPNRTPGVRRSRDAASPIVRVQIAKSSEIRANNVHCASGLSRVHDRDPGRGDICHGSLRDEGGNPIRRDNLKSAHCMQVIPRRRSGTGLDAREGARPRRLHGQTMTIKARYGWRPIALGRRSQTT